MQHTRRAILEIVILHSPIMVTSNSITGEWADKSDNKYMVLPLEVLETTLSFLIQPEIPLPHHP